jgi:hypothetical protein
MAQSTPEKHRDYNRNWSRKNPARQMLINSRQSAKRRGLEHTITLDDIRIPTHCPVLGYRLQGGEGLRHHASPSLDRIDTSKGYVPGNVWVISWRANNLKADATTDELILLARAIAEKAPHGLYRVPSSAMEVVITPGTY